MPAVNLYTKLPKKDDTINPNYSKNHMFKLPCRALICGSSGSGKSNTLINCIQEFGPVFTKIIICLPTDDEPLYNRLKEKLKNQVEFYIGEKPSTNKRSKKMIPNIPPLDQIAQKDSKGWLPQLVIFDDMVNHDFQDEIINYYIRARKKNITCFYLSQSYFKTHKTIRINCNYLLLKRNLHGKDLNLILRTITLPCSVKDLNKYYHDCTRTMEDFLMIDTETSRLYKSFEIEPIYDAYGTSQYEQEEPEQPKLEELETDDKYKYDMLKVLGVEEFCKALCGQYKGQLLPYVKIKQAYEEYCKKFEYPKAHHRLLGANLGRIGEKMRRGATIYYSIA